MRVLAAFALLLLAAPLAVADPTLFASGSFRYDGPLPVDVPFTVPAGSTDFYVELNATATTPEGSFAIVAQLVHNGIGVLPCPLVKADQLSAECGMSYHAGDGMTVDPNGWALRFVGAGSADITYRLLAE